MFGLTTVTAPQQEPLTLQEVKLNLRIEHDFEDERLKGLIVAAREFAETYTGRAFITQTLRYTLDCFPRGCITLPKPPLQSITSIVYYSGESTTTTLTNNTDYRYDIRSEPGRIEPVYSWPAAYERLAAVTITYVAGYGSDSTSVPQQIREGMHCLIRGWYTPGMEKVAEERAKSLMRSSWAGTMAGSYG